MSFLRSLLVTVSLSAPAHGAVSPEPQIHPQPEAHYVGLEIIHRPGDSSVAQLWAEFSRRAPEIQNVSGPAVGLAGSFRADGTATYAAAREVSDISFVPAGMKVFSRPAGTYADFTIQGPISGLAQALDYIYGTWLPKHGYPGNGDGIEIYPDNADVNAPSFEMHLRVQLTN